MAVRAMHPMDGRPVLVVDDDVTMRQLVAEVLELAGYPVETAADGEAALAAVELARPSLIVTDLHMPNLDGAALVELLHQRGFDPPILLLTGTTRSPDQIAEALGADGCLLKPVDIDRLLALVEQLRIP